MQPCRDTAISLPLLEKATLDIEAGLDSSGSICRAAVHVRLCGRHALHGAEWHHRVSMQSARSAGGLQQGQIRAHSVPCMMRDFSSCFFWPLYTGVAYFLLGE